MKSSKKEVCSQGWGWGMELSQHPLISMEKNTHKNCQWVILWSFKNLHLLHIWMQRSVAFQVRKNRLCVVQSDFQWDRTFTFVLATFLGCAMAESSPRVNLPPLLHPTGPPVVIFDVASQSPALSWLRWAAPYRNVNKHRHWGNRAPAGILTPGHRFSSEFIAS